MTFKVGGLFSGVGGIELGFQKAGFDIAWANEFDREACITYRKNSKYLLIEKDVYELKGTTLHQWMFWLQVFHVKHSQ